MTYFRLRRRKLVGRTKEKPSVVKSCKHINDWHLLETTLEYALESDFHHMQVGGEAAEKSGGRSIAGSVFKGNGKAGNGGVVLVTRKSKQPTSKVCWVRETIMQRACLLSEKLKM